MIHRQLSEPSLRPGRALQLEAVPDPARVAVLLNRNARQVDDRLAHEMQALVGRDNLFYSHSLEEAELFARQIVQQGYGTVVCGGGDGTLTRTYNMVRRYLDESNAWRAERLRRFGEVQQRLVAPRFACLLLGTGNGLHRVVGAASPLADLRRLVEDVPTHELHVDLVQWGEERFTFGGIGYDAMLLGDYNALRRRPAAPLLRPWLEGLGGYAAALVSRTLPRLLAQAPPQGRVVALTPGHFVDGRRGDTLVPVAAGSTLYEGPMNMVGVGTTPFYGFGFRVFPFAGLRPGSMQLRVAALGPGHALGHLPGLWRGSYRNHRLLHDFLVGDVRIELTQAHDFQHSGDAQGPVSALELRVAAEKLRLVDMYR